MRLPWTRRYFTTCFMLSLPMVLAVAPLAHAQQTLETKPVEASLFKNGLGFIVREAEAPAAGEYVISDLPVPVHGTFWILSESKSTVLEEAVAFNSPRTETTEALTLLELLRANVGKAVEVRTETDGWTAGTLVATPEVQPTLPPTGSHAANQGRPYDYRGSPRAYRPPSAEEAMRAGPANFVLLRTEQGMLALPPGEIKGVRCPGAELDVRLPQHRPGAALRLKVSGQRGRLRIAYLAWGMTWAPSYQVDISDPKRAALRCKAAVMNDIEDLDGATVNFITGYPNLAFAEVADPLALRGDVSDFFQSLVALGSRRRDGRTPVVTQQMIASNMAIAESAPVRPMMPSEGEVREDLFLYPRADVSLRRGERAYYPLFTKDVPYDSVYVWDIEDSLDESSRWRHAWWYERSDQRLAQEEIWHSLRLTNTAGLPWTTAPAMTVQEGRVLGQDVLFYTSPGANTLLKITRAVDVQAEQGETEVERDRDARTAYQGRRFDLVTIKGELRVFNHKNKPITLLIKKTLSGEVLKTAPEPEIERTTRGVWRVNPQQVLTWELPVPAGGKQYVTYQYKVYAAR